MNAWEKEEGMYHRGVMCHDCERRGCGSADMDVWRLSDLLDPIKPKAVRVVWLNNSLVTFLIDYLLHLQCLWSIATLLNAPWGTKSLGRTLGSICAPAMDNTTR